MLYAKHGLPLVPISGFKTIRKNSRSHFTMARPHFEVLEVVLLKAAVVALASNVAALAADVLKIPNSDSEA